MSGPFTLASSSPRVISLLPAATEIVAALGVPQMLVGITHECDHPTDVVRTLPHVTSTPIGQGTPSVIDQQVRDAAVSGLSLFRLNEQLIADLEPTVLLTQALCEVCAVNENDVRALGSRLSPAPTVVTLSGTTFDGVFQDVRDVAQALNMNDAGELLLKQYRDRLEAIDVVIREQASNRPRVVAVEWTDPVYLAGHWVPELIARAGGIDVMVEAGTHSFVHTVDDIQAAAPDLLLIAPCGYDVARAADEAADLLAGPEWQWAKTIPVWALDANSLTSRPGPRIVDGVETLASVLHPQLFSPPSPSHALRVI